MAEDLVIAIFVLLVLVCVGFATGPAVLGCRAAHRGSRRRAATVSRRRNRPLAIGTDVVSLSGL